MRILLCCAATVDGGLGHFFRSIALAEEARDRGFRVAIGGPVEVPLAIDTARDLGIELIPTELSDAASVLASGRMFDADTVHVDSYDAPAALADVFSGSGILLSSMEDGDFGRRTADVAIDPSPGAELIHRRGDGSGLLLRGLSFAPMRATIRDSAGWRGVNRPRRIAVMIGGTDPLGLSDRICAALREGLPDVDVHVVRAGRTDDPAAPPGVTVHSPSGRILPVLEASDLAIVGAGTTVWELSRLGVPMAVVRVVGNQRANFRFATSEGLAVPLGVVDAHGMLPALAIDQLRVRLSDEVALRESSERGRKLVDGAGAARIVDAWAGAASMAGLVLRTAVSGDASLLFDWRNDPAVRAVSTNSESLEWGEHLAWFSRALTDPDIELFIATVDGRPTAQIRFDRRPSGRWRTSIIVDPSHRNRGLGSAVIRCGESLLRAAHGAVAIEAAVASDNQPSIRLFESSGYRREPGGGSWISFEKTIP